MSLSILLYLQYRGMLLQKLADDSTVFPEDIARMYSRLE